MSREQKTTAPENSGGPKKETGTQTPGAAQAGELQVTAQLPASDAKAGAEGKPKRGRPKKAAGAVNPDAAGASKNPARAKKPVRRFGAEQAGCEIWQMGEPLSLIHI